MRNWVLASAVALAALGCGDNSRSCGDGTIEQGGFCVPWTGGDAAIQCGPGTVLDPLTATCQVDPAVCQNGTVLIDMACVDPAVGTVADLQEGPEPNGLGVIEASGGRAGTIVLKAGGSFVIHGTIDPSAGPDVDTYVLVATQPVLLRVTADGVHGVDAAFVVTSPDIAGWKRFGLDLGGDASKRQVFLPKPATYYVSIADTRTLFELADTGTATAAPGGPDADYYVAVTGIDMPAPTALGSPVTATAASGELVFYTANVANGSHPITLAMPSTFAVASLDVTAASFFAFDDEDSQAARVLTSALGTTLIVVDHVYNVSPSPVSFQLSIQ